MNSSQAEAASKDVVPNGIDQCSTEQTDEGDEKEELRCGWGKLSPDCCQKFHNPVALCLVLSIAGCLQGITVNGLVSASITTLEKRFYLTSTHAGIIIAMFDLSISIVLIPTTYFGGRGHKGRWIAIGAVIFAFGSAIFALPQFLTGQYEYEAKRESLCDPDTNATNPCSEQKDEGLENMFYLFLLGQCLHGLGCASLFTLTYVYLDENSSTGTSAVLIGVFSGINIMGAAIGYLMAGAFLNIYGDFYLDDSVDLKPEDEQWYGAWWLGFLVSVFIALAVSIPIFGFARELSDAEKYKLENAKRNSKLAKRKEDSEQEHKFTLKELGAMLKLLLCNSTFVCLIIADAVDTFLLNGFVTFAPKFLEQQFGVTASQAAIYGGLAIVPGGGGGCIVGGIIVKKFKLSTVGTIRFGACTLFISLFFLLIFLMSCDQPPVVGMPELESASGLDQSLLTNISSCNSNCQCWNKMYDPYCDPSGRFQFYSPCHAGCVTKRGDEDFTDCACVSEPYKNESRILPFSECKKNCVQLIPFLILLFLLAFFTFLSAVPNIQGVLRCVHHDLRSLATGVTWIIIRVVGNVPSPVAIGAIIDQTCLAWTKDCGQGKNCLYYDTALMGRNLVIMAVSFRVVSSSFFFLASIVFKEPGTADVEDGIEEGIGDGDGLPEMNESSSPSKNKIETEPESVEQGYSNPALEEDSPPVQITEL